MPKVNKQPTKKLTTARRAGAPARPPARAPERRPPEKPMPKLMWLAEFCHGEPRTWNAHAGMFKLCVTRHRDEAANVWRLLINNECVGRVLNMSATEAQVAAELELRFVLTHALNVLEVRA